MCNMRVLFGTVVYEPMKAVCVLKIRTGTTLDQCQQEDSGCAHSGDCVVSSRHSHSDATPSGSELPLVKSQLLASLEDVFTFESCLYVRNRFPCCGQPFTSGFVAFDTSVGATVEPDFFFSANFLAHCSEQIEIRFASSPTMRLSSHRRRMRRLPR